MRDPERIDKICNELASLWKSNVPDWRLMQLICNLQSATGSDLFYIEDEDFIKQVEEYFTPNNKE